MSDTPNPPDVVDPANEPAGRSDILLGAGQATWLSLVTVVSALALTLSIIALVKDNGGSDSGTSTPQAPLSEQAQAGQSLAQSAGCAGCHGANGEGGVGPAWVGLLGSERTLDDGTTVTADDAYLRQAILDPTSQVVEGFTVAMPAVELTPDGLEAVIAYIKELG